MEDHAKHYRFEVTGRFYVDEKLKPEVSHIGNLTRFKLPDGRAASLVVALEIEVDEGMSYEYVTSEREMRDLGFEGLDYDELRFHEAFELDEDNAHCPHCGGIYDVHEGHSCAEARSGLD